MSMGAAAGTDASGHAGYAMLIEDTWAATAAPYEYTWAEAVADGAGSFPYDPGPPRFEVEITVTLGGNGHGTVSGPISCRGSCSEDVVEGVPVTLSATPAPGSKFRGWSGACSGAGACKFTPASDQDVTASFVLDPPETRLSSAKISSRAHVASFVFSARGDSTGFQCALVPDAGKHHKQPRAVFSSCRSPKTYKRLRRGSYQFRVRATGPAGRGSTAAVRRFRID